MLILDTDILVDIQRDFLPAQEWFARLESLPSVPGLVVMELIQGARNPPEVRKVLGLVDPLPIIWPTETDCNRALSDFTVYHLTHGLGLIDTLIAATVIGASGTLCTFNTRHYRVIAGLEIKQPYQR